MDYNTENQYYLGIVGRSRMAEGDDAYYFVDGSIAETFLYYMDKETLECAPLCGKPNCLHDKEQDVEKRTACGAFVSSVKAISWYNGELYVTHIDYNDELNVLPMVIDRYSAEGNFLGRVAVVPSSLQNCMQHRGIFYMAYYETVIDNGRVAVKSTVARLDPKKGDIEELFTFQGETALIYEFFAYGDYIYFETTENKTSENGIEMQIVELYYLDLKTNALKKIDHEQSDGIYGRAVIYQDQLLFSLMKYNEDGSVDTTFAKDLYMAELDGSNQHKVGTLREVSAIYNCYDDILIVRRGPGSPSVFDFYKDFKRIGTEDLSFYEGAIKYIDQALVTSNAIVFPDDFRTTWFAITRTSVESGNPTSFVIKTPD